MNAFFLAVQWILLGKDFPKYQILQLPATFLFGVFIDLGIWLMSFIKSDFYPFQAFFLFVGCILLAFGITLQVLAQVLYLPGDGIVKALAQKYRFHFSRTKVAFDCTLVVCAAVLGIAAIHHVEGIREGTVFSACAVGIIISFFLKKMRLIRKWCYIRRSAAA